MQGPGRHALCLCTRDCAAVAAVPLRGTGWGDTEGTVCPGGSPGGMVSHFTCSLPTRPVPSFTERLLPAEHSGPSAE